MDLNIQAVSSNLLLARSKKASNSEATQVRENVEPEKLPTADLKWTSLMEELSTTSEIDSSHVDKLSRVIQAGLYSPDSSKVAEKLIDFEQGLP